MRFANAMTSLAALGLLLLASSGCGVEHHLPERTTTKITEEGGQALSPDGNTMVEVPAGAVEEPVEITIEIIRGHGLDSMVTELYELGPSDIVFEEPVTLWIGAGPAEENERIAIAKMMDGEPVELMGSRLDAAEEALVAEISSFSRYGGFRFPVDTPKYDPCEGKECGEECTLCDPADPDCIETDVIKYCDMDGVCSSSEPDCEVEVLSCKGENPAGCIADDDCHAGEVCVNDPETCLPSACSCDAESGQWLCTADCGGGICVLGAEEEHGCEGPNPAGCLSDADCGDDEVCVQDPDTCHPSVCGCDETTGSWVCTTDCGGGDCVKDPTDTCTHNQDCADGEYCAKPAGDCDGEGRCKKMPQDGYCPHVYDPVCGCDGQTYSNACFAYVEGVNVDYEGVCLDEADACFENDDCDRSEYCEKADGDCEGRGQCRPRPAGEDCPRTYEPVCGCDGRTYTNSCRAALEGVSIDYEGYCKDETDEPGCDGPNPAGCLDDLDCDEGEVCVQDPDICLPSACGCDEESGVWMCTTDCAGGVCEEWNPCAAKSCGEKCTVCNPNDPDCVETTVIKHCNADGECTAGYPACDSEEEPEYDPCGGKSCGDACTVCDPDDLDCNETAVMKYCDINGACRPEVPICDAEDEEVYDPCEGKKCGEPCTLCDPDDPDCAETDVMKYCDDRGQCGSSQPEC